MEIDLKSKVISSTPVVQNTPGYSLADQVGTVNTLSDVVNSGMGTATLVSVHVVDNSAVKMPFDIIFFNASPTLTSADNAALNIADAEGLKEIGRIAITSYSTNSSSAYGTATLLAASCGLKVQPASGTAIYYVMQSTANASGAYNTTTPLNIKFGFDQD